MTHEKQQECGVATRCVRACKICVWLFGVLAPASICVYFRVRVVSLLSVVSEVRISDHRSVAPPRKNSPPPPHCFDTKLIGDNTTTITSSTKHSIHASAHAHCMAEQQNKTRAREGRIQRRIYDDLTTWTDGRALYISSSCVSLLTPVFNAYAMMRNVRIE